MLRMCFKKRCMVIAQMKTVGVASAAVVLQILLVSGCANQKHVDEPQAKSDQVLETFAVQSRYLDRDMRLPAEILPYQDVPIYPKITGFIKWIGVDRGSLVKKGQVLVRLVAPELQAQREEAQAKTSEAQERLEEAHRHLSSARALKSQAQAKMDSDKITYDRLKKASETPGVVAQNEVDVQEKQVEADQQLVASQEDLVKEAQAQILRAEAAIRASSNSVKNIEDLQAYLTVSAPFDGVITERNMHEGSLAYPPSGANGYPPMLRIKQNDLLRIVIPVPEIAVSDLPIGAPISFTIPAFPGRQFTGNIARLAHSLDVKTRTMPVELNYWNKDSIVAPGMFPEVRWPMKRAYSTMFVPAQAVAITLEKPFVIKVSNGSAQWVNVQRGQVMGNMVEVFGDLEPTDEVVLNASDQIKDGSACVPKRVGAAEVNGTAAPAEGKPLPLSPADEPGAN
jgi:membrane fusion protein (multidrug efflux system)